MLGPGALKAPFSVYLGDRQAREAVERLEVGEWSPEKIAIRRVLCMEDSTVFY